MKGAPKQRGRLFIRYDLCFAAVIRLRRELLALNGCEGYFAFRTKEKLVQRVMRSRRPLDRARVERMVDAIFCAEG